MLTADPAKCTPASLVGAAVWPFHLALSVPQGLRLKGLGFNLGVEEFGLKGLGGCFPSFGFRV